MVLSHRHSFTADIVVLWLFIDHAHVEVVQHLRVLHLLLHELFRQDHMTQVRDQVCVDPHVNKLGLRAQNVDKFDAHSFDIE